MQRPDIGHSIYGIFIYSKPIKPFPLYLVLEKGN